MKYFKFVLSSFKFGICFNLFTLILLSIYTLSVEYYFRPFKFVKSPFIEFGTAVASHRIFADGNPRNYSFRPDWAKKIEPQFDLFIPEFQFRADWKDPAPRLERWCKTRNCCVHRISFNDSRIKNFLCFTLDDWYLSNRDFLGSPLDSPISLGLDAFLRRLPSGSRVIVNEPYMLFANPRSFSDFTQWFLALKDKHPGLKFEIGIQIHLQLIDSYWYQYHPWLFPALRDFSRKHEIRWGITEFSIFNRLWKPRIAYNGSTPERMRYLKHVESFIPERLRDAFVAHQAYLLYRSAIDSGATSLTVWGNYPILWFSRSIEPDFKSSFALWDWDGNTTLMYWAIVKSLHHHQ
jgi:hypothetical protein